MSRRQQITIKEVAAKAGVSQMTVSRVLNRATLVREETRERVEAAIKELNYRPNLMARGLAAGKSLSIGLIYNNPSHGYLGELLIGALRSCRFAGHHLMIEDLFTEKGQMDPRESAERLFNTGLDGVIIAPPLAENREVIDAIRELGMAMVRITPGDPLCEDPCVTINDALAAESMTQYLINAGHKKIGFIHGPSDQSSSAERYAGFRSAMAQNGLEVKPEYVVHGDFTYRSGMMAAQKLLNVQDRPSAIFASNDDMAAGAIAAAHSLGIKVPGDLSVAGFDDTPIANAIWPRLTTVRQPIAEMAETAVSLLSDYINGESSKDHTGKVLEFSIAERESVGKI